MSTRIGLTLAFIVLLPALATVAAPPPLQIHTPTIAPSSPGPNDQVTVNVTVTPANSVQNVSIHYTTDNWKATNTTVSASYNLTTQIAIAHIPPQYNGGHVEYYVVAYNNNNNEIINNNGGSYFSYTVASPTPSSTTSMWIEIAIVVVVAGAGATVAFYTFRPKPSTTKSD